ncbi:MAG: DUF2029 domain-containing protein [Anaerolineae bacterium]|nr:DUF2029 domain-containing protein [Anaerolineae bacterium]
MGGLALSPVDRRKLMLLALVGVLFVLVFAIMLNVDAGARHRSDIYLRWYATQKLWTEGRNLYDPLNGQEVTTEVYGVPWVTNFFYPAYLLVFVAPLALLPYQAAHLVWTVTIQLFYLAGLWVLVRLVRWPRSVNGLTLLFVTAVLFMPTMQHTIWGQFNTIGLLGLALCYWALARERYGLAGVFASALTFKPHVAFLPLLFLLIWSLLRRERWLFFAGFGTSVGLLWLVAELFQPGWVAAFLPTLSGYGPREPILDRALNPFLVITAIVAAGALALAVRSARGPASSLVFAGGLALTISAGLLILPAIGFIGNTHAMMLPLAVVLLLAGLSRTDRRLTRAAVYITLGVWALGFVLYGVDLATGTFYWSEVVYNVLAPFVIVALSALLCWKASTTAPSPFLISNLSFLIL